MKKLFTLIAFLAVVMGAKAEWVKIHTVDYSQFKGFPYYVMGYVPEWTDGVMTDLGGGYAYTAVAEATEAGTSVFTNSGAEYIRTEVADGTWHQYFFADGIPTELDGAYTLKALVRASEAISVPVQMRWSWGEDPASSTLNITTEWQEVECDFTGINGTSCSLIAQPNTAAKIEWKSIEIWQNKKQSRPVEWLEQLTNGNAETPWGELVDVRFNDQENNFKICAWGKEKGTNVNENGGSDPHPAEIITEADGNHAFIVRGAVADTEGDAAAWDNQFWIQSPQAWKAGTQIKVSFRYKASQNCKTNTQIHKQNPSDYLHWEAVGDVNFTTEWQEFEKTFTFNDSMNNGWSIAFNLNPDVKDAVDFYFDDLSWQIMKLDEGYFVASQNTNLGIAFDYDNAPELVYDDADDAYVAIVGEMGNSNSWINEIMISTKRGQDQAFKSNTIKPAYIKNDADDWATYVAATNYKIKLPAAGVWKVSLAPDEDPATGVINFVKLEGEEDKEQVVITPNPTEVTLEGAARISADWDNQLWIISNRPLNADEETVIEFDYVGSLPEAKTGTQGQGVYGEGQFEYLHWNCIGEVVFKNEVQHFSTTYKVPAEAAVLEKTRDDGSVLTFTAHGIVFNMAIVEEACNYTIKNVIWKTADDSESLIDMTGGKNFWIKSAGGGVQPVEADGIEEIVAAPAKSNAIYNLAGQRVAKSYKGVAIKNGQKYIVK